MQAPVACICLSCLRGCWGWKRNGLNMPSCSACREVIKTVDLRNPHQWFPVARALQRRWVPPGIALLPVLSCRQAHKVLLCSSLLIGGCVPSVPLQDHLSRGPHQQRQDVQCAAGHAGSQVWRVLRAPEVHLPHLLHLRFRLAGWGASQLRVMDAWAGDGWQISHDWRCWHQRPHGVSNIFITNALICLACRLLAMEVYDTCNAEGLYCNLITGGA